MGYNTSIMKDRPENDPCPTVEQLQSALNRAALDHWLAVRNGFLKEARECRRFRDRLASYLGTAKSNARKNVNS